MYYNLKFETYLVPTLAQRCLLYNKFMFKIYKTNLFQHCCEKIDNN